LWRRAWLVLAGVVLPGAVLLGARPCGAQPAETTVNQSNSGAVTLWSPIIAEFYVKLEQTRIQAGPETTPPPTFADSLIKPLPQFSVVEPPDGAPASLPTDWSILQSRANNGESLSGWLISSDGRRPRIYAHRVFDAGFLVGYPVRAVLRTVLRLDVPEERLPIPDNPSGDARRDKLLANTRVVRSVLTISRLSGVSPNGLRGTAVSGSEERPPVAVHDLSQPISVDYVARFPTTKSGDGTFGDVLNISAEIELEVGKELGMDPPERKTVQGDIRMAIGDVQIGVDVLSRESRKK